MPDTPLPASSASPKTPIGPEDFPAKIHGVDVQYDGLSICEGVPPTRPLKGKLCAHGAPCGFLGHELKRKVYEYHHLQVIDIHLRTSVTTKTSMHHRTYQRFRSIESRYRSRRQRKASVNDNEGDVYMLEGRFRRKTFVKVGRSVDFERRLEQHQKTCKGVIWRVVGIWPAVHCHKAESCIHLKMKSRGFNKTQMECSCRRKHSEWYEYPGMTTEQALARAECIILKHPYQKTKKQLHTGYARTANSSQPPLVSALTVCILACSIASTLQSKASNIDRTSTVSFTLLAELAPFAKAYGFDIHLGQSTYTERGDLDTGGVEVNSKNGSEYEYPGDPLEADFVVDYHDDVCSEELVIDHVFSLDGVPMDMDRKTQKAARAWSYDTGEDIRDSFINGTYNDGTLECEIEPYSSDGGPFLVKMWTRKVLFISPRNSPYYKFSLRLDTHKWSSDQLKCSRSDSPTVKEKKLVDGLLVWLKQRTSKTSSSNPHQYRYATHCLLKSAYRWKDADMFKRVFRACTRDALAIVGADNLLGGYHTFGGEIIKALVIEASKTEPSCDLRLQLVEKLLAAGRAKDDSPFVSWCTEQIEAIFGKLSKLSKLEAGAVNLIVKFAKFKPNPTQALQDMVLSKFGPVVHSDSDMWEALFDKLLELGKDDPSPFDQTALRRLSVQCLQRIALELPPYTTTSFSSRVAIHVKHVLVFVKSCLQHDVTDAPLAFFRRMRQGVVEHDRKSGLGSLSHLFYSELVKGLDALIRTRTDSNEVLGGVLKAFFKDAVEVMLPYFKVPAFYACSDQPSPLEVACSYLDDPVKVIRSWLDPPEQNKNMNREGPILNAAKRCFLTLRERDLLSQDAVDELIQLVTAYVENHTRKFNPTARIPSQAWDRTATASTDNHEFLKSALDFFISATSHARVEPVGRLLGIFISLGTGPEYVKNVLVPFLADIKMLLAHKQKQQLLVEAPYSEFAAGVVEAWLLEVLGSRPFPTVALKNLKVGCDCALCTRHLVPVLNGGQQGQRRFRPQVTLGERRHMEGILEGLERWGVTWKVVSVVGELHKFELAVWMERRTKAQQVLESLGTEEEQQKIMGSRYRWAKDFIAGNLIQSTPPVASTASANPSLPKRPLESLPSGNPKRPRLN
ncbi:hypothetical protein PM082_019848 [Marasmius tenuissimus]|nr:hypothetical protein PM082_019848 [Marasmius tenuissimus]